MSARSALSTNDVAASRESWVPMIAIALGQVLMSFNVASLPVALSGMVNSFGVPPTTVATGIVAYSMLVAGRGRQRAENIRTLATQKGEDNGTEKSGTSDGS